MAKYTPIDPRTSRWHKNTKGSGLQLDWTVLNEALPILGIQGTGVDYETARVSGGEVSTKGNSVLVEQINKALGLDPKAGWTKETEAALEKRQDLKPVLDKRGEAFAKEEDVKASNAPTGRNVRANQLQASRFQNRVEKTLPETMTDAAARGKLYKLGSKTIFTNPTNEIVNIDAQGKETRGFAKPGVGNDDIKIDPTLTGFQKMGTESDPLRETRQGLNVPAAQNQNALAGNQQQVADGIKRVDIAAMPDNRKEKYGQLIGIYGEDILPREGESLVETARRQRELFSKPVFKNVEEQKPDPLVPTVNMPTVTGREAYLGGVRVGHSSGLNNGMAVNPPLPSSIPAKTPRRTVINSSIPGYNG